MNNAISRCWSLPFIPAFLTIQIGARMRIPSDITKAEKKKLLGSGTHTGNRHSTCELSYGYGGGLKMGCLPSFSLKRDNALKKKHEPLEGEENTET